MDADLELDAHTVASTVVVVRQDWLDAVRAGDAERLAAMVTGDVVVVHGKGRAACTAEMSCKRIS
jgi:ketosteroid isomerase-like protein